MYPCTVDATERASPPPGTALRVRDKSSSEVIVVSLWANRPAVLRFRSFTFVREKR